MVRILGTWTSGGLSPEPVQRGTEKQRELRRVGVTLSIGRVAVALMPAEHAAALYHLSANAVRYYSLPLLVIGGIQPFTLPAILLLLIVAPLADHRRLRPQLSLYWSLSAQYGLELVAYRWDSGAVVGNGAPCVRCCRADLAEIIDHDQSPPRFTVVVSLCIVNLKEIILMFIPVEQRPETSTLHAAPVSRKSRRLPRVLARDPEPPWNRRRSRKKLLIEEVSIDGMRGVY